MKTFQQSDVKMTFYYVKLDTVCIKTKKDKEIHIKAAGKSQRWTKKNSFRGIRGREGGRSQKKKTSREREREG